MRKIVPNRRQCETDFKFLFFYEISQKIQQNNYIIFVSKSLLCETVFLYYKDRTGETLDVKETIIHVDIEHIMTIMVGNLQSNIEF